MKKHVIIIGCGDIGLRTAAHWLPRAATVHGVARSESSISNMREAGITPLQADLDMPDTLAGLPTEGALLYYFAPPPRSGAVDTRMANFLPSLVGNGLPSRFVYLSTSGVYGDQDGRVVTETSPLRPTADRARRRLDAEQQVRTFGTQHQVDHVILRVGGIYGPGRLPEARLRKGTPIIHEHLAPRTNRIHADDLAQVCVAAATNGSSGETYNVCDGADSNMTEYFRLMAAHLGLPAPPEIGWDEAEQVLSPGMLSYLRESRHMDNSKMLNELKVRLRYPSLQDWLAEAPGNDGK